MVASFTEAAKRFIEEMPIQILGKDEDKRVGEIEKLVNKIASDKKEYYEFYNIWKCRSEEIKDEDKELLDILNDEEENVKNDNDNNTWFDGMSFGISKNKEKLDEKYDSFSVHAVDDESTIIINGARNGSDRSIFEIKFKDKTMLDHFYFSIMKALESGIATESLKALFEKTTIPVLSSDLPYKTTNLMKNIIDEFSKRSKFYEGVVKLENEIKESEAKMDYLVFGMYGVSKQDAKKILGGTAITNWYANKVLQLFE